MTITQWAQQFTAITSGDINSFTNITDINLSLHEMKCLFSEQYQDKIAFSYTLQVEKNIVNDLHIEPINEIDKEFGEDYPKQYSYGIGNYEGGPGEGCGMCCGGNDGKGFAGDYGRNNNYYGSGYG